MRSFVGAVTLVACVTACGDDGVHHLPDGPTVADGGVDSGPDAAVTGDVTVTTLARCCTLAQGTPVAAVPVVTVQPDGTVGPTGSTDDQGNLTLHGVHAGATITAVYPEDVNLSTYLSSIVGVKPSDHLTFGDGFFTSTATGTAGTMTVNVPAVTGAITYYAYTPCGGYSVAAPTVAIPVTQSPYCQTATAPIVAIAVDDASNIIASAYLPTANFANDAVVDVPAWTPTTANNFTTSISGLVADITGTYLGGYAVAAGYNFGSSGSATIAAGAASVTSTVPPGMQRTVGYAAMYRSGLGEQDTYKAGAASATSATLVEPTLPWIGGGLVINAAIGKATWLQTDGTYDAAVVDVHWTHFDIPNETNHNFTWNVIVPPGLTALDFGSPPAALVSYLPSSTDSTYGDVQLIDLASASNYDAIRALPEWQSVAPDNAVYYGDQPAADIAYDSGRDIRGLKRRVGSAMHLRR